MASLNPNLFEGIRFHLAGFQPEIHDQVKSTIVSSGGVYVADYSDDCTHVIVFNLLLDDPICAAAIRNGKTLVTVSWIHQSLITGKLANASSIIFRPLKELNGIPGAKKLVICLTGYQGYLRDHIEKMVQLMGAQFSKPLNPGNATHLICYKFEGAKYLSGCKHPKIKLVNHRWLEDCLKKWDILPEEHYCKSGYELEMLEAVIEDSEENGEQNVRKTSSPLHVGEESGNINGESSKRSNESLIDHSTPSDLRKTARKSKSRKLMATASKRVDASEPGTPVCSPLKKRKNSSLGISSGTGFETVRESEDKLLNGVPCESLTMEKLEVGKSDMGTRVVLGVSSGVDQATAKPQFIPENASFSPELKKLESLTVENSDLNADVRKVAARKKLGSRLRACRKTTDAQKGSLSGSFSKDNVVLRQTSEIARKDNAISSIVDNDMAPQTVDGSNTVMVQINDAVNPVNWETYEAEPFANTYKHEGKQPENQHSAQKKVISDHTKEKIVVRAPKEVFQDADVDVGRKVGEEKESVNGNAVTAAGKKMRGDQLMKELVQVESSRDKHDRHDDKLCKKLAGTFNSEKVQIEVENERDPCANNECTTKVVKQAAKKRRRTILSTKSTSHISAEKEDMQVPDGKSGTLSGKSNASGFGDDPLVLNKAEKEREPLFHEDEGKSNGDAPKSTPTPRDDNAISSDSVTIPSDLTAIKNEQACFLVSGHRLQRKEFQRLIKRLKGKHCRDSHQWCYKATHFVVPDPIRRTEKFFAAAASGSWILKSEYLTESIQAGKFLPEDTYEWHKNALSEDSSINLEAPRKWRLLREKTGHGAFHGMRIVVYGQCIAPSLDTLKRVVKAGEGTILATAPPYTRFLDAGVDFAVVSQGIHRADAWVQDLLRHEIPCVSVDYLVDYVCKPGHPLDKHVLYNTHKWAAKSFARLSSSSIESATPKT